MYTPSTVVAMELNGMQIDLSRWRELEKALRQEEEVAKKNLAEKLNVDINRVNFNSQKQVRKEREIIELKRLSLSVSLS